MHRSSANQYMNDLATRAAYTPYNVSRSNHDLNGGSRFFYHQKDLAIPYQHDDLTDDCCIIMCDVDYYCDINAWAKLFQPIILYTAVPTTVSYRNGECSYYLQNNRMYYDVAGGGHYDHLLWNYTGDTFSVCDDDGNLCVYNIEQKMIAGDEQHRIVWLVPMARVEAGYWEEMFNPQPIRRKNFVQDGITYLYDPVTDKLSLKREEGRHAINIAGRTYEAIRKRIHHKEAAPVVADVERLLIAADDPDFALNAPLLFELITDNQFVPNVVHTTILEASFQPIGTLTTEDGKPSGVVLHNPLVANPSVMPTRSVSSDEATIAGRVEKPRNGVVPTAQFKIWATEFVKAMVPNKGRGIPLHVHQMQEYLKTGAQKQRFRMVSKIMSMLNGNRLQCFVKAEPYATTNDPRNITTMSAELTILMSCFVYAFKRDISTKQQWYGPTKTPKSVCRRLQQLARHAKREGGVLQATDYSRFDGSISEFLQKDVVLALLMRWCSHEHRPELRRWFNQVFLKKATTQNGVRFEPGWGTRSGSPITTEGNTFINAFVSYCAARSGGSSTREAIDSLGIYCGDDGLVSTTVEAAARLEATAKQLGLKMTAEIVTPGDPVPYCGRYFVDPITTDDSFQDPMRTLSKLHLTANKNVSREQGLTNKATGYMATDSKTPLIGTWARRVLELTGLSAKNLTREEEFKAGQSWPQQDSEMITAACAKILGVFPQELRQRDLVLAQATLDGMPALLTNYAKDKILAVKGDVVQGPYKRRPHGEPKPTQSGLQARMRQGARRPSAADKRPTGETAVVRPQVQKPEPARATSVAKPCARNGKHPGKSHHRANAEGRPDAQRRARGQPGGSDRPAPANRRHANDGRVEPARLHESTVTPTPPQ